ncbi:MAG: helix-turn-helix transcriptional regulator [Rhodanobacter sp.]
MTQTTSPVFIEPDVIERIYSLWDAMARIDVADADNAMHALLDGTRELLAGENAMCAVVVRMPQVDSAGTGFIWRPRHVVHLDSRGNARANVADAERRLSVLQRDVWSATDVAGAGTWRAKRLCDVAPPEWFKSQYYENVYTRLGLIDSLWVVCPINTDVEIYLGIYRGTEQSLFEPSERDIALFAMRGLRWFLQRYLLSLGLNLATAPLTESERKVLHLVLHGRSPKAIAKELSQSVYTTQGHIQAIYQKFNVTRRAALAALWTSVL